MDRGLLRADLNLLKVLHVLLEERNVTRAAERLFVTQPAISRSLNRLRQLFNDPLLVRSSHGLVPTERALELAAVVSDMIERLNGVIEPPAFDPRAAQGVMRVAAPESFALGSIPRLALAARAIAPRLRIESLHLPDDYLVQLEAGSLDFAINHQQPYPDAFVETPLIPITPQVWFGSDHPLKSKREIGLSDICSYPIISFHSQNVSREGDRLLWQAIKKAGLPLPQIILDTSHLLVTLEMLMMSDSIMLGPEHLSRIPAFREHLLSRPMCRLSTFGRGQSALVLLQHERTARSPLHIWMAEMIKGAFDTLKNAPSATSTLKGAAARKRA